MVRARGRQPESARPTPTPPEPGSSATRALLRCSVTGVVADTAYQGGGPTIRTPQRRRRLDLDTGRYRRLSRKSEGGQRRARSPTRAGRASQRRAEELADSAQD